MEHDSTQMTEYVVTRWYRAPELLLGQDDYTCAIDMWSVGCLIAELYIRRPLFPGNDVKNQIEQICSILGKPTSQQISTLQNQKAQHFLNQLEISSSRNLQELMQNANANHQAIHLVDSLLQFDPSCRLTAQQALSHPFLAEFRDETTEIAGSQLASKTTLEPPNEKTLGRKGIRNLMWNEIQTFHSNGPLGPN